MNILAVEDDKDIISLYENLFGKVGAKLYLAFNLEEIEDTLKNHEIDVVLMDYSLEDSGFIDGSDEKHTGLTLTKAIRKNPEWKNIPVVLVTAHNFARKIVPKLITMNPKRIILPHSGI